MKRKNTEQAEHCYKNDIHLDNAPKEPIVCNPEALHWKQERDYWYKQWQKTCAELYDIKAERNALRRCKEAIWWAIGLRGDFGPFEKPFGWRTELRQRCGITDDEVNQQALWATNYANGSATNDYE